MDLTSQSLDLSGIEEIVETVRTEHTCELCNYKTADKSNFNKHLRTHGDQVQASEMTSTPMKGTDDTARLNEYICDQCGKTYKSKYGLKIHRKTKHELTYKHLCQICGKGYNQTIQYRFHCSQHLEIVADKCRFCHTEFVAPGSLTRHLKICESNKSQTDKTSYTCDICQATFKYKQHLNCHVKGKHQPPRYECKECGKRFAWRSSLKAHRSRCHRYLAHNLDTAEHS